MEQAMMNMMKMYSTNNAAERGPTFLTNPYLKLIMFGGKGGVGKTTSAAASSLYLATLFPEKKILLASIDPAHSLQDSLIDFEGLNNLEILEISAEVSFKRFKEKHQKTLRTIASRGTFLDDEDISRFLSLSMPGLDELMAIISVTEFLNSSRYDLVVLDTAPTGHTLRFLELPEIMQKWLNTLDSMMAKYRYMKALYAGKYRKDEADEFLEEMSRDVLKLRNLLQDETRCEFVPVMVPEKLVTLETERLLSYLKQHEIHVKNMIINKIYQHSACPFCKHQHLSQTKLLEESEHIFAKYNLVYIKIPLYPKEIQGIHALNEYRKNLVAIVKKDSLSARPEIQKDNQSITYKESADDGDDNISPDHQIDTDKQMLFEDSIKNKTSITRNLSISSLIEKAQIIIMGGKGGVGKSTLSCAMALQIKEAYPSRKILLISTDPAHSLSDCLNLQIGENEKELSSNFSALEINSGKEFEALKDLYNEDIEKMFDSFLGNSILDLKFDKDVIEGLLDFSPPGLDEVIAVAKIVDYIDENRHDVFILDTAPTGHLIRFLELPDLIENWLKVFFNIFLKYGRILHATRFKMFLVQLSKKIKKLRSMLSDHERTIFFPVAIPTKMALTETEDLTSAVGKLKINYPLILLNMVIPKNDCVVCADIRMNQDSVIEDYFRVFPKEKIHFVFRRAKEPRGQKELGELSSELSF